MTRKSMISTMEYEVRTIMEKASAILNILSAMEEYDAYRAMFRGCDTLEKRTLRALADSLHVIVGEQYDYLDELLDRIPRWEK